jgi:hypothetical protein
LDLKGKIETRDWLLVADQEPHHKGQLVFSGHVEHADLRSGEAFSSATEQRWRSRT